MYEIINEGITWIATIPRHEFNTFLIICESLDVIIFIKSTPFESNILWLLPTDSANVGIFINDAPIAGHWEPMSEKMNHIGFPFSSPKNWK